MNRNALPPVKGELSPELKDFLRHDPGVSTDPGLSMYRTVFAVQQELDNGMIEVAARHPLFYYGTATLVLVLCTVQHKSVSSDGTVVWGTRSSNSIPLDLLVTVRARHLEGTIFDKRELSVEANKLWAVVLDLAFEKLSEHGFEVKKRELKLPLGSLKTFTAVTIRHEWRCP